MSEYVYSFNEDSDNWHDSIEEAVQDRLDNSEDYGDDGVYQVTMLKGEQFTPCITDYIPSVLEHAANLACDECYEWQSDPFDYSKEEESELQDMVDNLVEKYCRDKGIVAGFYYVQNVKEISVCFVVEDGELKDVKGLSLGQVTGIIPDKYTKEALDKLNEKLQED